MGGSTHWRLPIHREEPRPVYGDDRSTPKCRRESRGTASPRRFGAGIASAELRQTTGAFPRDERPQTIMNEGCAFARSGHPLGFLNELLVQIDRRTHSIPRDAPIIHHMMHTLCIAQEMQPERWRPRRQDRLRPRCRMGGLRKPVLPAKFEGLAVRRRDAAKPAGEDARVPSLRSSYFP